MTFRTWLFEIPKIYKSAWRNQELSDSFKEGSFFKEGAYRTTENGEQVAICDGFCAKDRMYETLIVYKDKTAVYQAVIGETVFVVLSFKNALRPIIKIEKSDHRNWAQFEGLSPCNPVVKKRLIETFDY